MPTKVEKDEISGIETTGHEWDGIKELNSPLPRWWVWLFLITILFALIYWVLYPAWPTLNTYSRGLLGYSGRGQLAQELETAREDQASYLVRIESSSIEEIAADPELREFAIAGGHSAFAVNCSQCHGSGAQGGKGFPNLNDDDWLWGGTLADIETTIRYGIRASNDQTRLSEMPAFGADELLTAAEIADLANFALSLSGREHDIAAAERGRPLFEDNCVACHGDGGQGMREVGAPRLDDQIWLYGGDYDTIMHTITNSRRGVMPTWDGRLDDAVIKELTVYVHALGGGE